MYRIIFVAIFIIPLISGCEHTTNSLSVDGATVAYQCVLRLGPEFWSEADEGTYRISMQAARTVDFVRLCVVGAGEGRLSLIRREADTYDREILAVTPVQRLDVCILPSSGAFDDLSLIGGALYDLVAYTTEPPEAFELSLEAKDCNGLMRVIQ